MLRFRPLRTQIAIDLLHGLLVSNPTAEQISAAESLIVTMFEQQNPQKNQRLPLKEWQCLYWASQGRSINETADLLQISEATVKTYRSRIKTKLKSKNFVSALYEANKNDFYLLVENIKK